jgi:outer membrane beta-barrel protein
MGFKCRAYRTRVIILGFALLLINAGSLWSAEEDMSEVSPIFRDMGVVQNKAMNKSKKVLFAPSFSLDFSDGPYTMYGLGLSGGYALSDFWEVYAFYRPSFVNRQRLLAKAIEEKEIPGNQKLTISGGKARSEIGAHLVWAPLYGKDSLGIRRIIRSDTFLRLGVSQVSYDLGSGMKFALGVGKTFFLSKIIGIRLIVEQSLLDIIIEGQKSSGLATFFESGAVFYF